MRSHVIALRRCAQDHHQRAADYNAAALALFTALLLFRVPRCTTVNHYTVTGSWPASIVLPTPQLLQHGAYTENAFITGRRFDIFHARIWRTSHEVEGGEETRSTSGYSTYRFKPMQ